MIVQFNILYPTRLATAYTGLSSDQINVADSHFPLVVVLTPFLSISVCW